MHDDYAYTRTALGADLASISPDALQPLDPNTPLVYPFIPAPTLQMETLEEDQAAAAATELPTDDCPPAGENMGPSTPTSTAVTTASVGTTPQTSPDEAPAADAGHLTAQDDNGDGDGDGGGSKEDREIDDEARCSLSYVRRVQSGGDDAGAAPSHHLLHGQVWRGGGSGDKKRGWRRHQWVIHG
jgi:hypothetical protein